jgi:acetate---CoA ligase (ADP-forming)
MTMTPGAATPTATATAAAPWAQALLWPGSVALVGVSDAAAKTAGRPLNFLRRAGWQGTIYPVNPRRDSVQGERAWPDLASLPERPDHVFILTGAEVALATLAECNRLGVPLATVLAGGFPRRALRARPTRQRWRGWCGQGQRASSAPPASASPTLTPASL